MLWFFHIKKKYIIESRLRIQINHNKITQTFCAIKNMGEFLLSIQRSRKMTQNVLFEPTNQEGKFLNKILLLIKRVFESISTKYFYDIEGFFRIPSHRRNLVKLRFSYKMCIFTLVYIFQRRGEWKKLIQLQPTAVSRVGIGYCSSLSKTNISCLCWVNYSEKQNQKSHLFLSKDHVCICVVSWWTQKIEGRSHDRPSSCSVTGTEGVVLCQCDHCLNFQTWLRLMRGVRSKSLKGGTATCSVPLWNSKPPKKREL